MKQLTAFVLASALLAGCGGNRAMDPIAVVTPLDAQADCDAHYAEMTLNQSGIQNLYAELDQIQRKRTRNLLWGGLIGYATSDDGSAARAEIAAYHARNERLLQLMREKGCLSGTGMPTR